ncbi:hypothetical protein ACHAWO_005971 [Cyclotella atomus]|uniref:Uncharacterized protein n=1 Tax=Cyclotella atomus TaxID=382360 RepID=A0ABD3PHJ9_9STRA
MNRASHLFLLALLLALGSPIQSAPDEKPDAATKQPAPAPAVEAKPKPAPAESAKEPKPAPVDKEPKPAPVDKEPKPAPVDKEKDPKPVPTDVNTFNYETGEPTAIFNENNQTQMPTPSPSIDTTSPIATENLPSTLTHMPSEDLPLTLSPTLEPTGIILDPNEIAPIPTNKTIHNETHPSLYKSDASHYEIVADEEDGTHYKLQYGLIATCIMLVLLSVGLLGCIKRKVNARRKEMELPTITSSEDCVL